MLNSILFWYCEFDANRMIRAWDICEKKKKTGRVGEIRSSRSLHMLKTKLSMTKVGSSSIAAAYSDADAAGAAAAAASQ